MSHKYQKQPVVIEARQWAGGAAEATPIINWVLENGGTCRYDSEVLERRVSNGELSQLPSPEKLSIDTLEGTITASPGDWIIKGVEGEFYPCKPEIFSKTYLKVSE